MKEVPIHDLLRLLDREVDPEDLRSALRAALEGLHYIHQMGQTTAYDDIPDEVEGLVKKLSGILDPDRSR